VKAAFEMLLFVSKILSSCVQFYVAEKKRLLDYCGYVVPHRRGRAQQRADGTEQVLSLKFAFEGAEKPVSTMFIGCSPEFEFALLR